MAEMLVILGRGRAPTDVEAVARVRQRYGDRILLVATEVPERLRALSNVSVFAAGTKVPEPAGDFSETEKMGIAAWNAQGEISTKRRPGDGLPWDAKGFKAP